LAIVLSVLGCTVSDYPFGIFKRLTIVLSVLGCTASDYPFGIFKRLTIVLSVLGCTPSDYPFGIFKCFFFFFVHVYNLNNDMCTESLILYTKFRYLSPAISGYIFCNICETCDLNAEYLKVWWKKSMIIAT
jgi:hypothetical protein